MYNFDDSGFVEIEYDTNVKRATEPLGGQRLGGNPVSQTIDKRQADPIRQKFYAMRALAVDNSFGRNDASNFYKQACFMADFSDDYEADVEFSMYFPTYQRMSYEQLRCYFTWRTRFRKGEILPISTAYLFIYIYELLANVGVESSEEGLDKLMALWSFQKEETPKLNSKLDQYLPHWLRDYHIYYALPHSFRDFVYENGLQAHYPELYLSTSGSEDSLDLWNGISSYDIEKSVFYLNGNEDLVRECFYVVLNRLREECNRLEKPLEDFIYRPFREVSYVADELPWHPFANALFYPWKTQENRQVALSSSCIYHCKNQQWMYQGVLLNESGKELVGYLLKQMEFQLRTRTKYKYKIKVTAPKIENISFSLDKVIEDGVNGYYAEKNRIVVEVNPKHLAHIRQEALGTQEKLIVPEEIGGKTNIGILLSQQIEILLGPVTDSISDIPSTSNLLQVQTRSDSPKYETPLQLSPLENEWTSLKHALTSTELETLGLLLQGGKNIKEFADSKGIMLEVLADSINEKAVDHIGDNILELDGEMILYEDYVEQVAGVVNE